MKSYPDHGPAAYVGFATFLSALDHLRESSLNEPLDPVDCGGPSKATWNQLTRTFRFLELIDDDNLPTPSLRSLVQQPNRKPILRKLLQRHYSDLFSQDLSRLRLIRLEQLLARRGIHGATLTRARSFFVGAAKYAGINLSSEIRRATRHRVQRPPRTISTDKVLNLKSFAATDLELNETVSFNLKNLHFAFSFPADFAKLTHSDRNELYHLLDNAVILNQRLNERAAASENRSREDITELDVDDLRAVEEAVH
jgi:hypothetical protein